MTLLEQTLQVLRGLFDQFELKLSPCSASTRCCGTADLVMKARLKDRFIVIAKDCLPVMLRRLRQVHTTPDDMLRNAAAILRTWLNKNSTWS